MNNYTSAPRAIEIRGSASGYASLLWPASTCIELHRHYGFYERLEKAARESRGKTRKFNLGARRAGLYERRFRGGTPDSTFAHRGARINPGESCDSGFIHAGALVHAPE
jgi:hypothetical protein